MKKKNYYFAEQVAKCGIYAIANIIDMRVYIGQAQSLKSRCGGEDYFKEKFKQERKSGKNFREKGAQIMKQFDTVFHDNFVKEKLEKRYGISIRIITISCIMECSTAMISMENIR